MFSTAIAALPQLSYAGLFVFLLGGAIFIPVPEEITLLTAGYLVAKGVIGVWSGMALAVIALFAGDIVLFSLAYIGSSYAQKLRERVNKIGLEKTWIFSPTQPLRAVFILRFLTGFRFIAPVYAGFEQVSWKKYSVVNLFSIGIYVPIMFALGFEFHTTILAFIAGFELVRHIVFIAILAFAGVEVAPGIYRFIKDHLKQPSSSN